MYIEKCKHGSERGLCKSTAVMRKGGTFLLYADWGIVNLYDQAPLHMAVMLRDEAIVNSLLAHGADPNQRVRFGRIALDYLDSFEDPVENAKALRIREILLNAGSEFRPVSPFVVPATSGDE